MSFRRVLLLLIALFTTSGVHADDRLPIPDEAAQKEAAALVQEVFGPEIENAKTPEQKLALTKKLLEQSARPDTSPAGRYALLKAALEVAPDAHVAMSVIDNIAKQFQLEVLRAKAVTIRELAKSAITTSQRQALADSALELSDLYLEQDDFEASSALVEIALKAATRSRDYRLARSIEEKKDRLTALREKFTDVQVALAKLETDPTNAKSNLIVGKYECFAKGNWEAGIPMLALGDDDALKELATQDLRGPKTSNGQVELAEGWYQLAEKSEGANKERILQRAGFWYQLALKSEPTLSGLVKSKVERRLKDIVAAAPGMFGK